MSEREIAIIGPSEVVKPFLALGLRCIETQDSAFARLQLHEMEHEQKVGVIFIAESLAEQCIEDIEMLKQKELPAVFILPEYGSVKRLGLTRLEKTMAKAIGKKL